MSELSRKFSDWFVWRAIWWVSYLIARTLRYRVEGFDRLLERVSTGKGLILVVWHGRTLLPIYYCRNMGFWAIISLSRDGEIQNRVVSRYGYHTIRGSSGKKGARAFLESVKRLQQGVTLAVTPDGPKGPAGEVQVGTVLLAQRSGSSILPIGAAASPRKLLGSWDGYMVPAPFGRSGIVLGELIDVPADLTEDGVEEMAARIRIALNEVEERAEKLVSGHV